MSRIILLTLLAVCYFAIVFSQQPNPKAGQVHVRGYELQLQNREGKCILTYVGHRKKGDIELGLLAPCEFVRDNKGSPQFYTYKGHGNPTVLIITGGPIDTTRRDSLMKDGCGTQIQVISLRQSSVKSSKVISDGPTVCPSQGLDEKVFGVFAP